MILEHIFGRPEDKADVQAQQHLEGTALNGGDKTLSHRREHPLAPILVASALILLLSLDAFGFHS